MTIVPQPPRHIPAGWYPHPQNPTLQQYWDGSAWTPAVAPAALVQLQPYAQPGAYLGQPFVGIYRQPPKVSGTAYLFAILLGGFGAHQFYLGNVGAGIGFIALWWGGWALTSVGIGVVAVIAAFVWWIVDLCTLPAQVDTANRRLLASPF